MIAIQTIHTILIIVLDTNQIQNTRLKLLEDSLSGTIQVIDTLGLCTTGLLNSYVKND